MGTIAAALLLILVSTLVPTPAQASSQPVPQTQKQIQTQNDFGDWNFCRDVQFERCHGTVAYDNTCIHSMSDHLVGQDSISSIRNNSSRTLMLFEHNNFQGYYFLLYPGNSISDLRPLGWNDRISSAAAEIDVFEGACGPWIIGRQEY